MKLLTWIAFGIVVVAQWYVPVTLVTKSEQTLKDGKEFHFKTQPVDPSDPFRGKYITLNFEAAHFTTDTTSHLYNSGEAVYASIVVDSAGYAMIDTLYTENPGSIPSLVKARVSYIDMNRERGTQTVYLEFPFERLYLEESKASEAEKVYWENNRRNDSTSANTYAVVRIRDEHAVLVDVMINDRSMLDIVREINKDDN